MMIRKSCAAVMLGAAFVFPADARATVIDFNLPPGQAFLGQSYSQDGYSFASSTASPDALGNWVAVGFPQLNADDTADIFEAIGGTGTTITVTNNSNTPFSFTSIGLAPVFNNSDPFALHVGGVVQFTFFPSGGGAPSTQSVTLVPGVRGLQTFSFNEDDLSEVVFSANMTDQLTIQFDDIGVSTSPVATPLPPSLPLFAFGLGVVGLLAFRKKRRMPAVALH